MSVAIAYLKIVMLAVWIVILSLVGVALGLVAFPFLFRHPKFNSVFAVAFAEVGRRILGWQVRQEGSEYLDPKRPAVYVANHQSGLDMVTMGRAFVEGTVIIGKKQVLFLPFFGLFYWIGGNILIDRSNRERAIAGLDQVVEAIRSRGVSVWMFPEGTRSAGAHTLKPFKKGAFHMAIAAQVPVVPVVTASLDRWVDWKRKRISRGTVGVRILPPISTRGMTERDVDALAARVQAAMQEALDQLNQAPAGVNA